FEQAALDENGQRGPARDQQDRGAQKESGRVGSQPPPGMRDSHTESDHNGPVSRKCQPILNGPTAAKPGLGRAGPTAAKPGLGRARAMAYAGGEASWR